MNLSQGQRIGPSEILARLGGGGMGDVYRAHDARLGRDVAALNHPHIVTIFWIEDAGSAAEGAAVDRELESAVLRL